MREGVNARLARNNVVNNAADSIPVTISAEDQARQTAAVEAKEHMNQALLTVYEQVSQLVSGADRDAVIFFWNLGKIFRDVASDPNQYGKRALSLLTVSLSLSPRYVSKACIFANEYDEAAVRWIVEQKNAVTNKKISVEHIRHLLVDRFSDSPIESIHKAETMTKRREYIRRAVEGSWAASYLAKVIEAECGKLREGGRPHSALTNKDKMVADLHKFYTSGQSAMRRVWHGENSSLIAAFGDLTGVTEDTAVRLDEAIELMRSHVTELTALLREIDSNNIQERIKSYLAHMSAEMAHTSVAPTLALGSVQSVAPVSLVEEGEEPEISETVDTVSEGPDSPGVELSSEEDFIDEL